MLQRPLHPKQKPVTLIVDVPNKVEIENDEPFSSASNLNLITSLRTGRVNIWNKEPIPNFKGINSIDIFKTYLDYDYFGESTIQGNFDFSKECAKRKQLYSEEGRYFLDSDEFFPIPHQKDLYVSKRLWGHIQSLVEEIKKVDSKLIILTGKWSLFFLTGMTTYAQTAGNAKDRKPLGGLTKFRSSLMKIHECWGDFDAVVVPIYHTVHSSGMLDKIPIMEIDIQKLSYRYEKIKEHGTIYFKEPPREYIVGTDYDAILSYLQKIKEELDLGPKFLSADIETMFNSTIDCIGLTTSKSSGVCVPFSSLDRPYIWTKEQEIALLVKVREILLHPNAKHVGQNYQYDCQYYFFQWKLKIHASEDTMVLHHILYNYLPKDLAFLASVYCEFYSYWKDDIAASVESPETRWIYNVKDIQYTLEVLENLLTILEAEGGKLKELYYFQQQKLSPVLVDMMERGVRVDVEEKNRLYTFFKGLMVEIEKQINAILGFDFNQNSTPQKKSLFKDFFGMVLKVKKKGGNETCDATAMLAYISEYPRIRPFLTLMLEYASLKVFVNNFLGMKLDEDGRARTQYRIAGTATGRLASTKNVRGKGGNLMNIPEKGKIKLNYAVEVLEREDEDENEDSFQHYFSYEGNITLPNIKKIFLPDEGKEIMDADLSGADIQVVAWDSQCKWLMDYFSNPNNKEKVYRYIANNFFQREISDDEYKTYKGIFHGCVTGDHEILTKNGWVKIEEYDETNELAVWNPNNWNIHFEVPKGMNRDYVEAEEDLYFIKGDSFDFLGTQDHKFPYLLSSGNINKSEAVTLNKTARIPYTGKLIDGKKEYPSWWVKLLVAFQADGYVKKEFSSSTIISWHFKKKRKIDRLISLLKQGNIEYNEYTYGSETHIDVVGLFTRKHKILNWSILKLSQLNLTTFVDELIFWDGTDRTSNGVRKSFFSVNKEVAEITQTIIHLTGRASKIYSKRRTGFSDKICYEVSLNNRTAYNTTTGERGLVKHEGTKVYCPQTSTGFFMCRRNGNIYVSGNTNYLMGVSKLAAMAGITEAQARALQDYYFHLNPEIKVWHTRIEKDVKTKGYIQNIFGRRAWFLNRNDATLMNKAAAFIPQSSIADVMNRALVTIEETLPEVEILLQVHDSGVFQYDIAIAKETREKIKQAMEVVIPYKPQLIIPSDFKVSTRSYGDTEKVK